jgi:hypothetical protein
VELGQVFSEYFGTLANSHSTDCSTFIIIYQPWAGKIGQLVADVWSGLSLAPLENRNKRPWLPHHIILQLRSGRVMQWTLNKVSHTHLPLRTFLCNCFQYALTRGSTSAGNATSLEHQWKQRPPSILPVVLSAERYFFYC